jgi:hypothetical protein
MILVRKEEKSWSHHRWAMLHRSLHAEMLLSGGREENLKMKGIVYLQHLYWRGDLGAGPRIGVTPWNQWVDWRTVNVKIGVQLVQENQYTHRERLTMKLGDQLPY